MIPNRGMQVGWQAVFLLYSRDGVLRSFLTLFPFGDDPFSHNLGRREKRPSQGRRNFFFLFTVLSGFLEEMISSFPPPFDRAR